MFELDVAGRPVPSAFMLYRTAHVGELLAGKLVGCECGCKAVTAGSTVAVEYAWREASGVVFYRVGMLGGPWLGVVPAYLLHGYAL